LYSADELLFGIGVCVQMCAVLVFIPLIPLIGSLAFHYSRAAHFTIISDVKFFLTIALGIIGSLFVVAPSIGGE